MATEAAIPSPALRRSDANPFVLLRRGKPPLYFPTQAAAESWYDRRRFQGAEKVEGVVKGPGGGARRCYPSRGAHWHWLSERERALVDDIDDEAAA